MKLNRVVWCGVAAGHARPKIRTEMKMSSAVLFDICRVFGRKRVFIRLENGLDAEEIFRRFSTSSARNFD